MTRSDSVANTDDKVGHYTFWGELAPGWGCEKYALRWVVHPVHTGLDHLRNNAMFLEIGPRWKVP